MTRPFRALVTLALLPVSLVLGADLSLAQAQTSADEYVGRGIALRRE